MSSADVEGMQDWFKDFVIQFLKGESWHIPITRFIDDECIIFDNEEENKFEYTTCHNNFKDLINDLLAAHLLSVDVTPEMFEQYVSSRYVDEELRKILVPSPLVDSAD